MGQEQSQAPRTVSLEQLTHDLTLRFQAKCYTSLELYHFKHLFRAHYITSSGLRHWTQAALTTFLALPEDLPSTGPVLFSLCANLAAFPFPSQAPSILDAEGLFRVVTLLTRRYERALPNGQGRNRWHRTLYEALAVYDRLNSPIRGSFDHSWPTSRQSQDESVFPGQNETHVATKGNEAAAVTQLEGEVAGERLNSTAADEHIHDEDDLAAVALQALDAADAAQVVERPNLLESMIPMDNFLRILEYLLVVAAMGPLDDLPSYAALVTPARLRDVSQVAQCILAAFCTPEMPGIPYRNFMRAVDHVTPFLFDCWSPLFEHLLFAREIDLARRASMSGEKIVASPMSPTIPTSPRSPTSPTSPHSLNTAGAVIPKEGEILTASVIAQLSFFLHPLESALFYRLRPLYSGAEKGFSMGNFEKSVFNWQGPTILLVSGTLLPSEPSNSRERAFHEALPTSKLETSAAIASNATSASSRTANKRLVYGAFVPVPWQSTSKTNFSSPETMLFQLSPVHDVFPASSLSSHYAYFSKPVAGPNPGIGLGSATPGSPLQNAGSSTRHRSVGSTFNPGPVSLHIDDAIQYACFTHLANGGGSFRSSSTRDSRDWQDRFEIDAIEVWGVGGEEEAKKQRKAWEFEEAEARRRRNINIGKGDIEADRELLKMAGIIQGDRSGGSIQ